MTERYTELSSHLRQKSQDYRPTGSPDRNEEERMILAMTIGVGVSVSLITAFSTVIFVLKSVH